jgi:hypothetical protein
VLQYVLSYAQYVLSYVFLSSSHTYCLFFFSMAYGIGGMITLTDLYCIFNRARGTELVSPDDLLKAASIAKHLGLGLRLRVFPSGVKVLQGDAYSEAAMGKRILSVIEADVTAVTAGGTGAAESAYKQSGLQAADLAIRLNISLVVAKEQVCMYHVSCIMYHVSCIMYHVSQ